VCVCVCVCFTEGRCYYTCRSLRNVCVCVCESMCMCVCVCLLLCLLRDAAATLLTKPQVCACDIDIGVFALPACTLLSPPAPRGKVAQSASLNYYCTRTQRHTHTRAPRPRHSPCTRPRTHVVHATTYPRQVAPSAGCVLLIHHSPAPGHTVRSGSGSMGLGSGF
jgi:hypothetical protein